MRLDRVDPFVHTVYEKDLRCKDVIVGRSAIKMSYAHLATYLVIPFLAPPSTRNDHVNLTIS